MYITYTDIICTIYASYIQYRYICFTFSHHISFDHPFPARFLYSADMSKYFSLFSPAEVCAHISQICFTFCVHIHFKYISDSFSLFFHICFFPYFSHRFPIELVHIFHACSPYISHIFVHICPIKLHVAIYLSLIFMFHFFPIFSDFPISPSI